MTVDHVECHITKKLFFSPCQNLVVILRFGNIVYNFLKTKVYLFFGKLKSDSHAMFIVNSFNMSSKMVAVNELFFKFSFNPLLSRPALTTI